MPIPSIWPHHPIAIRIVISRIGPALLESTHGAHCAHAVAVSTVGVVTPHHHGISHRLVHTHHPAHAGGHEAVTILVTHLIHTLLWEEVAVGKLLLMWVERNTRYESVHGVEGGIAIE